MRCFIAIELDQTVRDVLLRLLRELPRTRDARWCSEAQLHITLKFLGETDAQTIAGVKDAMAAAAEQVAPFQIGLSGLGCFPERRSARVLWCGVSDPGNGCATWLSVADPLLAALGFPPEPRAFTPHITLGRSKSRTGANVLCAVLDTVTAPPAREMTVEKITLFESRLRPQGAQYLPVATVPLTGK